MVSYIEPNAVLKTRCGATRYIKVNEPFPPVITVPLLPDQRNSYEQQIEELQKAPEYRRFRYWKKPNENWFGCALYCEEA